MTLQCTLNSPGQLLAGRRLDSSLRTLRHLHVRRIGGKRHGAPVCAKKKDAGKKYGSGRASLEIKEADYAQFGRILGESRSEIEKKSETRLSEKKLKRELDGVPEAEVDDVLPDQRRPTYADLADLLSRPGAMDGTAPVIPKRSLSGATRPGGSSPPKAAPPKASAPKAAPPPPPPLAAKPSLNKPPSQQTPMPTYDEFKAMLDKEKAFPKAASRPSSTARAPPSAAPPASPPKPPQPPAPLPDLASKPSKPAPAPEPEPQTTYAEYQQQQKRKMKQEKESLEKPVMPSKDIAAEQLIQKPVSKPASKPAKPASKPMAKPVEEPEAQSTAEAIEKPVPMPKPERPVVKPVEKPVEKSVAPLPEEDGALAPGPADTDQAAETQSAGTASTAPEEAAAADA
ncbi:hypothetical protein CYMTET_36942, partial [Cymbomonas tetramitiformis]